MKKQLTEQQKNAVWDLARKHGLMMIEQGTQKFDDALFDFSADVYSALLPDLKDLVDSKMPALHWTNHRGEREAISLQEFQDKPYGKHL